MSLFHKKLVSYYLSLRIMHAAVLMEEVADLTCLYGLYFVLCCCYTKYRKMQLHHVWLLCNKSHIYILHLPRSFLPIFYSSLHHLFLYCFCLFSFCFLYFHPSPSFRFHTFRISFLSFSSLPVIFPLELSVHTIANNLVEELHLCSPAFSINSLLSPSACCWFFL